MVNPVCLSNSKIKIFQLMICCKLEWSKLKVFNKGQLLSNKVLSLNNNNLNKNNKINKNNSLNNNSNITSNSTKRKIVEKKNS